MAERAALMITCLGDMLYPDVGVAIVRVLRKLGVEVDFPSGQTCCGLPLFNSGYHAEVKPVAARLVEIFKDAPAVVVPSGSCAWMVKHEIPGLLADSPLAESARALAAKTYELSQYRVRVLGPRRLTSTVNGRVTYHDSCHLLRGLHESATPRQILGRLDGVELVELPGHDECCGFGGSFSVRLPEVSSAILDKKLDNVEGTGAACVVACDAGCLMQMSGGLSRRGSPVRAVHLAELIGGLGEVRS
jgi:L-lactate dehydrogenase complex protein LldE